MEPETISALQAAVKTVSAQQGHAATETTDSVATSLDDQFQPPHPERTDPFAFAAGAEVQDESTTIKAATRVEVLGFANVGKTPRVLVRIGENIQSLGTGDSTHGVEVVSIREPVVELRKGSLLWTATMFDKVNEG